MSITVYNPSSKPAPEVLKTATRKMTLKGGILGIIDNSKPNSDTVLKRVADQHKARFELNEVIWSRKPTASLPITDDEIQKLTKKLPLCPCRGWGLSILQFEQFARWDFVRKTRNSGSGDLYRTFYPFCGKYVRRPWIQKLPLRGDASPDWFHRHQNPEPMGG